MPASVSPEGFKPLADTVLFKPLQIGALKLDHKIVQSPCTRMRGYKIDGVFTFGDRNVEYYSQRASKGGLQITEATDISKHVSPYGSILVENC
jgi:2,4-dienoyl-CoA reductase-like NADH-dependent reductase (Old Yellow Enzyme family)